MILLNKLLAWKSLYSGMITLANCKHNTEAKLRFANTCENTNKKQLHQVKYKKVELSLELAKTRLRVGFESATYCNQQILSLTHFPLSQASLTTDNH